MAKIIFEDIKHNGINQKRNPNLNNFYSEINNDNVKNSNEGGKNFNSNNILKTGPVIKQRLQRTPQMKDRQRFIGKPLLLLFIFVLFVSGLYFIGNYKHKTDIVLTQKVQKMNFDNQNFLASKNKDNNSIEFELMIISDKKFKKVILTEPKEVSIKAYGSITLLNEFSTAPQKLLPGTFISDNEGKTYQINKAVVIPGYTKEDNQIIPGQVIVEIISFLPGDSYNGSPLDFHIISFKGTNKYNKIYGKLKNPLIGGASGLYYSLNDIDKANLENIANTSLRDDLMNQVKVLFPDEYILYPNLSNFSYKNNDNFISKTPESEIEIEGYLSVVLLKKDNLMHNLIKFSLPELSKDEIKEINIHDLEKLSINFMNNDQVILKDTISIPLKINGDINLIWNPNIEILKSKLLGIHENEVLDILRQDKGIASASVKIFPPWRKYLPNDLSKINIKFK